MLSCTSIDDSANIYIGMMPSLKVVNLANTKTKGLINQEGSDSTWVPSFSALKNLSYLERLELEGLQIKDAALCPLSSFHSLKYLSLQTGILTESHYSVYQLFRTWYMLVFVMLC